MADFLLEIGVEEIPDWMIENALADLKAAFEKELGALGGDALRLNATPRRLALFAENLADRAPDVQNVTLGPYLSAGAGAAQGFARKWNTSVDQLAKTTDTKGERYVIHQHVPGETARNLLAAKLPEVIKGIRFPKTMYWTDKNGMRFIRPIRWLVALLNNDIVPFEIAGVHSGNRTYGHRILGSKDPIEITSCNYEDKLRENFVVLREEERKARIETGFTRGVETDYTLMRSLVYMTEFPTPIRGSFDSAYLELPREILSTVMRHHQRYFSVLNEDGSLAPEFVAITNTNGNPDGLIRQGNERVLRARFNDARFFWQADQRRKLMDRLDDLAKVTFQAKLGSYKDKTQRVVDLSRVLAAQTGADETAVTRAATLAKCDLTTDMVKEFTELQGIVGGLYAKAQGESDTVATAIYDHYKPVSMEDTIPRTLEGQVVSIADKLDTLRECFRVGLVPTGSKDPFALRRAAQGIVKILFEARLALPLLRFTEGIPELGAFITERIEFYLRDVKNYAFDEVNAVLAVNVTTLADLEDRVEAVHYVRPTEDFEPLAASFKRIKNILKQAQVTEAGPVQVDLLTRDPELDLYDAFVSIREQTRQSTSYREQMAAIASLRPKVDLFFDKILVNDPNPEIRKNRLALLQSLLLEFSTIADFSEIVTEGACA
ncbi:MAG TPA: glycine--tRNA ligase subunit beta [Bryobacteraceae bacterium]